MTNENNTTPAASEAATAAQPKPCCKCEAYREIQVESARQIARLQDMLKEADKYADWIKGLAKKAQQP